MDEVGLSTPPNSGTTFSTPPDLGKTFRQNRNRGDTAAGSQPVHCDAVTAAGIAKDTVKKQQSRSVEMCLFWITDQVHLKAFDVQWPPGQENLGDYLSKYLDGKHHQEVRPWYLHEANSPRFLPRAAVPSALRGCVGSLPNGYIRSALLPQHISVLRPVRVPVGHPGTSTSRTVE